MKFILLFTLLTISFAVNAQKIEVLTKGTSISIRGLSVVTDKIIWVSGSKGTVGKSIDGGITWKWIFVKDFEKRDFRDIEAFDENTAIIMAVAEPANILKTNDGGETWKQVYENKAHGMFLDAMEFYNNKSGIVIGDPINGNFFLSQTKDGGNTWQDIATDKCPAADSGEACFASSGTNIRKLHDEDYCFISGGLRAHYFSAVSRQTLPIVQGKTSTGANSIAVWSANKTKGHEYMIVVGGDFAADTIKNDNCFISKDAGKSWFAPAISPHGYRSCVEFINDKQLITCGTSGVDISLDAGLTWKLLSTEGFHVCRRAKTGTAVFLAGGNGKIGKLINY